jgi:hypothetical protein
LLFFTFFGKNWVEVVKSGKTACFYDTKLDNGLFHCITGLKNGQKTLWCVKTQAKFSAQNFWA